jgi:hypothetical protein
MTLTDRGAPPTAARATLTANATEVGPVQPKAGFTSCFRIESNSVIIEPS